MAYNASGELLLGKRRDTGLWTLPAGHLNSGEDPATGAKREMLEECGLTPTSLSPLKTIATPQGNKLYFFTAHVNGVTHSDNDPDHEVESEDWEWVDVSEGLPKKFHQNLAGPPGEDNIVRQVFDMQKSEQDEVSTLLAHPNPAERRMALKLDSVKHRHLQLAALDPDQAVYTTAIEHPDFDHDAGMYLMEAQANAIGEPPTAAQRVFLSNPDRVSEYHLDAAQQRANGSLDDVLATHPKMTPKLVSQMYNDPKVALEHRAKLLQHPNAPGDLLAYATNHAKLVPSPESINLAKLAITHPQMPKDALTDLIHAGTDLRAPQHVDELAQHALSQAKVPVNVIQELLDQARYRLDPRHMALRTAASMGPNATPEHATQAAAFARPTVQPNMLAKYEILEKAINPEHLSNLTRDADEGGSKLVDHKPDLNAHPPSNGHEVEAYRKQVLKSPKVVAKTGKHGLSFANTVSKKAVFQAQVPGYDKPSKFMLKPYHEKIIRGVRSYQRHPHQGWSEMTHQALFHAGGIGHLHQHVHVDEHNAGPGHEKEPMTVTHIAPDHTSVNDYGGTHYDKAPGYSDQNHEDVRKIALMSFLSGASDQHAHNLMVNDKIGAPLAIDNARNFQYVTPHRMGDQRDERFSNYVRPTALGQLDPLLHSFPVSSEGGSWSQRSNDAVQKARLNAIDRYRPTFEWWGQNAPKIKQTFSDRLKQIKDPAVKEHLQRNFDARAAWLDDRAKHGLENFGQDWYDDPVDLYKPGEVTDDEKENPEVVARAKALAKPVKAAPRRRVLGKPKNEVQRAFKDFMQNRPSEIKTPVASKW
jgi:ADP-ribose pyrophosphatase YjhB (NUDIX family)